MLTDEKIQELMTTMARQASSKPLIYVSGPFRAETAWKIEQNIRIAEETALNFWKLGAAVICPHTNTRFYQGEADDNTWLAGDLTILRVCDSIFMLPGWESSEGARVELAFAKKIGIEVLYNTYFAENYIKAFKSIKK